MVRLFEFSPIIPYVLLIIGFVCLIKGADYFVDGCSGIARKFKIPSVIIGLTIVAFGTSAPEAAVSITSSLKGANAMAVSNVIGSNLFNLLVVAGVCAIIRPLNVTEIVIKRDYPICIAITAVMLLFSTGYFAHGIAAGTLGRIEGLMLLIIFAVYIVSLVRTALKDRKNNNEEDMNEQSLSVVKCIFLVLIGGMGIAIGGELVVDCASEIAIKWGMTETLVGLTIVALGTSLPELVTSIVASRKGENDLAIGNVVGSSIFNILFVLGMAATVCPINLSLISNPLFTIYDMIILLLITTLVYFFVKEKSDVSRKEGSVMVGIYAVYMVYIVMR